jgi:2-iminobutanoate/2-iminopropanoate deaminase
MVYVSGCIAIDPETRTLVPGGIGAQTRMVLENLKNIVESSGSNMANVVKCTVLLTDMATFAEVNAIYAEYFTENYPARMTYAVAGLPLGALVEIDATAVVADS